MFLSPAARRYATLVLDVALTVLVLLLLPWPAFADTAAAAPASSDWLTTLLKLVTPALGLVAAWIGKQLAAAGAGWINAHADSLAAVAAGHDTAALKAKWELELLKFAAFIEHFLEAHLGELKDDLVQALADGKIDEAERAALIKKWRDIIVSQGGAGALDWLKTELGTGFEYFVQGGIEKALPRVLGDGTAKTATIDVTPEARPTAPSSPK